MTIQEEMLAMGKKKFNQIRAFVEELDVQLALGKAEFKDTFLQERKRMNQFLQEKKRDFQQVENQFHEDRSLLKAKFEDLEFRLQEEAAETKEAFDEQKEAILNAIYQLEQTITEHYGEVEDALQVFLDELKGKLDAYRIGLALGNFDDEETRVQQKTELKEAIGDLKEKLSAQDEARAKLDVVAKELTEAFDHMKNAFKEVFN
ncbi:MAG: hypothetical protein R2792_02960 [Saprospiraceae bacterium]